MTEKNTIVMETSRYKDLILAEHLLHLIVNALYEDATLSYNKEKLSLDESNINALLRLCDSENYWKKHKALKEEADNGTDKD